MRKWFIWAIVLIGCLPINKALAQQSGDAERNTLRIMSYNIRNGRGMDEVTDLGRIAEAIRKVAPDVVAVQEVDSVTGRSGGIDVLRRLGGNCSQPRLREIRLYPMHRMGQKRKICRTA